MASNMICVLGVKKYIKKLNYLLSNRNVHFQLISRAWRVPKETVVINSSNTAGSVLYIHGSDQ